MSEEKAALAGLTERVGALAAQTTAAHSRIDRVESLVREDLKGIEKSLTALREELKPVVAWMNRSKGWAAAGYFAATIIGGALITLIRWILKIGGADV